MPDLGQQRQVAQLPTPLPCSRQIADADAGCGGYQECVDQLERGGWACGHGVEQVDAATGGGGGSEGIARPALSPGQRVEGGGLRQRVVEPAGQFHGVLCEHGRLRCGYLGLGLFGEERVAQSAAVGEDHCRLGGRVVTGQFARPGVQRGRLFWRGQPGEDSGHPVVGRGGRGQVAGRGRDVSGALGGVCGGLPEVVGVVAAHPARGHAGGAPESSGRGSRVVGEDGGLLVAPLGLAGQVTREGQAGVATGPGRAPPCGVRVARLPTPAQPGGHRPPRRN